jgi:hypothetical protein
MNSNTDWPEIAPNDPVYHIHQAIRAALQRDHSRAKVALLNNYKTNGLRAAFLAYIVEVFDAAGRSVSALVSNVAQAEAVAEFLVQAIQPTLDSFGPYFAELDRRFKISSDPLIREARTFLIGRAEHWKAEAFQRAVECELSRKAAPKPTRTHELLKAADWEDIEMRFVGDHEVEISIAGAVRQLKYREIPGFEDRRTGLPTVLWTMLRLFASLPGGTLPNARDSKTWIATQKKIERMSRALGNYFGLTGDPFPYDTGIGYKTRIRFKPGPDNPHLGRQIVMSATKPSGR